MSSGDALASYAVSQANSRGRQYAEAEPLDDCPFSMDRQRILNCMAFRRLRHKTQVFVANYGDHFRTRLTHTLEVVAQAQRLAGLLRLNARLAGGIAMAHDLGHPPFGHAGEKALAELMNEHGGFEHNLQSLRVVDYLEHPYPSFRGLNLTFELRESLLKHQTWYDKPDRARALGDEAQALIESGPSAPLEGQVANIADAIAYTLHDIEDGLVDGALDEGALSRSRLWQAAADCVRSQFPDASIPAIRRPILDRINRQIVRDAASESERRIQAAGVRQVDDIRRIDQELVGFSAGMKADMEQLASILQASLYKNHRVVRMDSKARRLIREVFDAYKAEPRLMPERFAARIEDQGVYRVICDYIAGMTDRFCQEEHRRLSSATEFE